MRFMLLDGVSCAERSRSISASMYRVFKLIGLLGL